MNPVKDYMDVLQDIEAAVVALWRAHPTMTNYTAMRAYDAAIAHYAALARQHTPKPDNLSGLDAALFQAVKGVADWRLGLVKHADRPEVSPLPLEDMVACLRKLRKSVDFWTERGGRQGYLEYIRQYVH